MKKVDKRLFLFVVIVGVSQLPAFVFSQAQDYFADNGFIGPVDPFYDPSGQHYNGKTYITYLGPDSDPYVAMYDHLTDQWMGPVKAGSSELQGHWNLDFTRWVPFDLHGRPTLVVDDAGYIHIFFGGHGGDRLLEDMYNIKNELGQCGFGEQRHAVSTNPEDISSWKYMANISPFGTYSKVLKMDNGDIYLFYRHGIHKSDWVYQKSADNGVTFDDPVSILKAKPSQENPYVWDAWYATFSKGSDGNIHMVACYHPCGTNRYHEADARYNGYYIRFNIQKGRWGNVVGEPISLPLTKEIADVKAKVYDSNGRRSDVYAVSVDEKGDPHLLFRDNRNFQYTRWLGDQWQEMSRVCRSDQLPVGGDMVVESSSTIRVLANITQQGKALVAWWKSTDGGLTWNEESIVMQRDTENARIYTSGLLVDRHEDAEIVVGVGSNDQSNRVDFKGGRPKYFKMYLTGKSGVIPRND